jgi:hypothetical protein
VAELDAVMQKIIAWGVTLTVIFIVLWPLLALPAGNFSLGYFTFWVVLSMMWGMVASLIIVLLPIWEYRSSFGEVWDTITGKRASVRSEDVPLI